MQELGVNLSDLGEEKVWERNKWKGNLSSSVGWMVENVGPEWNGESIGEPREPDPSKSAVDCGVSNPEVFENYPERHAKSEDHVDVELDLGRSHEPQVGARQGVSQDRKTPRKTSDHRNCCTGLHRQPHQRPNSVTERSPYRRKARQTRLEEVPGLSRLLGNRQGNLRLGSLARGRRNRQQRGLLGVVGDEVGQRDAVCRGSSHRGIPNHQIVVPWSVRRGKDGNGHQHTYKKHGGNLVGW